MTNNKIFWKTTKSFLSKNVTKHSKINLGEGEKNISCDDQVAKTCSECFINIPNVNISSHGYKRSDSSEPDPILRIIDKSRGHPSVKINVEFLTSYK